LPRPCPSCCEDGSGYFSQCTECLGNEYPESIDITFGPDDPGGAYQTEDGGPTINGQTDSASLISVDDNGFGQLTLRYRSEGIIGEGPFGTVYYRVDIVINESNCNAGYVYDISLTPGSFSSPIYNTSTCATGYTCNNCLGGPKYFGQFGSPANHLATATPP
jgi:hypothetical protein